MNQHIPARDGQAGHGPGAAKKRAGREAPGQAGQEARRDGRPVAQDDRVGERQQPQQPHAVAEMHLIQSSRQDDDDGRQAGQRLMHPPGQGQAARKRRHRQHDDHHHAENQVPHAFLQGRQSHPIATAAGKDRQ